MQLCNSSQTYDRRYCIWACITYKVLPVCVFPVGSVTDMQPQRMEGSLVSRSEEWILCDLLMQTSRPARLEVLQAPAAGGDGGGGGGGGGAAAAATVPLFQRV